jgi:hypothetical protein
MGISGRVFARAPRHRRWRVAIFSREVQLVLSCRGRFHRHLRPICGMYVARSIAVYLSDIKCILPVSVSSLYLLSTIVDPGTVRPVIFQTYSFILATILASGQSQPYTC